MLSSFLVFSSNQTNASFWQAYVGVDSKKSSINLNYFFYHKLIFFIIDDLIIKKVDFQTHPQQLSCHGPVWRFSLGPISDLNNSSSLVESILGFLSILTFLTITFYRGKTSLQALVIASDGSSVSKYLTNSVSDLLAAFF